MLCPTASYPATFDVWYCLGSSPWPPIAVDDVYVDGMHRRDWGPGPADSQLAASSCQLRSAAAVGSERPCRRRRWPVGAVTGPGPGARVPRRCQQGRGSCRLCAAGQFPPWAAHGRSCGWPAGGPCGEHPGDLHTSGYTPFEFSCICNRECCFYWPVLFGQLEVQDISDPAALRANPNP